MRIAHRVVLYRAQAKTLAGVIGRLFQAAIVEHQRFALAVLQKELAVIGTGKSARNLAAHGIAVEVGSVEERGCGGIGHQDSNMLLSRFPAILSLDARQAHLTMR